MRKGRRMPEAAKRLERIEAASKGEPVPKKPSKSNMSGSKRQPRRRKEKRTDKKCPQNAGCRKFNS